MKTTDSVMREKYREIGAEIIRIAHKFGINEIDLAGELGTLSQLNKDLASHSLAEARREEREQRDSAWKKIIACHNCSGTGRTDNIGGAMECIECGGQCHNLVIYDGIHIDDLLTGDNPERKA